MNVSFSAGSSMRSCGRRGPATPVIVRRHALADRVPNQDLRVTKGHSLFIDDVLIPVEFLINHRTILWDDHAQEVTIYHIELETHDVLLANGAPAESYRDDGNRWLFRNANSGWGLPPQEPCAPVLTGGPVVDAAWRRLLRRSGPVLDVPLTEDADLHLWIDGQRVDAVRRAGDRWMFRLPAAPTSSHIVSRAAAPQELGTSRDPRRRTIKAADERLIVGYHGFEPNQGFRWTDGDAAIPASLFAGLSGPIDVLVHIAATAWYRADGMARRAA